MTRRNHVLPPLPSGLTQVAISGIVAFSCPGFFNALSGLGGAGSENASANSPANVALYVTFAVFGYFGGMFFNLFGPRILKSCGGVTYAVYAACAYINGSGALGTSAAASSASKALFVMSGALLGFGAALFWTAQGAMMMAYAPEHRKGFYIGMFWLVFNLGGFMGGILQFALNFGVMDSAAAAKSNAVSYFVFVAVMLAGSLVAAVFVIPDPSNGRVLREDGSEVTNKGVGSKTMKQEVLDVIEGAKSRDMQLLFLLFFGTNFFLTYVFNCFNGVLFNIRTRGLNSAIYFLSQMGGAYALGRLLDGGGSCKRRVSQQDLFKRATRGFWVLFFSFNVSFVLGSYVQLFYEGGYRRGEQQDLIDFAHDAKRWALPLIVLMLYGVAEAFVQTYSYWLMGACLAKDDSVLSARYTGCYKGAQSLGAAVAWALDVEEFGVEYSTQLWIGWAVFLAGLPYTWRIVQEIPLRAAAAEDDEAAMERDDVMLTNRGAAAGEQAQASPGMGLTDL